MMPALLVRRAGLLLALLLAAAVTGCASPAPALYTISPVAGPVRTGAPRVIMLRQIDVARYLERNQIVRSMADYRLTASDNDWWGEPLGAMLGRVLVEELSQRLPQSTTYNETGAVSATPDVQVELDVHRIDQDAAGNVVLQAQVGVDARGRSTTNVRSFLFSVPVREPGTSGYVAAVSTAVGELADAIATMLAAGRR